MTIPTTPAPLFGVLSLPAGNQYAQFNGELLPVETLLGCGAADLLITRGRSTTSACFTPREFRLVDAEVNDVPVALALAGGYAIGWTN